MDPVAADAGATKLNPNNQPATARMLRLVSGTLRSLREDQSRAGDSLNGLLKRELLPPAAIALPQLGAPAPPTQSPMAPPAPPQAPPAPPQAPHQSHPPPPPPQTLRQSHQAPPQQPRLPPPAPAGEDPLSPLPMPPPKPRPPPSLTQKDSPIEKKSQQQFHRRLVGDWHFIRTIGAGLMGKVKMAYHQQLKEICAVKIIPRAAKVYQRAHANDPPPLTPQEAAQRQKEFEKEIARDKRTIREGALGRLLFHPYICRLYEMVPLTNHYYMLFEYVEGGQMLDYIVAHGSLKEKHARKFARGIALALEYCHRNNVVHRDLKIENIMINAKGDIKIIDFGLLNLYSPALLLKTYCGSLYFAAPELLSAKPYTGPEVDVWLFGVVLYVLVCGKVPFDDQLVLVLHEKIKKGNVEYPLFLLRECVLLLLRMLVVDPSKRALLYEVINHPWMNKGYDHKTQLYVPPRKPLTLPLDPEIIKTIALFDLGSVQLITDELTKVLLLLEYQMSCENWHKITELGREYALALNAHLLPDPTGGFHPLISIYYLVDEMRKRKKAKEEALRKRESSANAAATPDQAAAGSALPPAPPSAPPVPTNLEAAAAAVANNLRAMAQPPIPVEAPSTPKMPHTPQMPTPPVQPTTNTPPLATGATTAPVPTSSATTTTTTNTSTSGSSTLPARLRTPTADVASSTTAPMQLPLQQIQAQEAASRDTLPRPQASANTLASSLLGAALAPKRLHRTTAIVGALPDPNRHQLPTEINVITSPGREGKPVATTVDAPVLDAPPRRPFSPDVSDMFKALDTNVDIAPLQIPEPAHLVDVDPRQQHYDDLTTAPSPPAATVPPVPQAPAHTQQQLMGHGHSSSTSGASELGSKLGINNLLRKLSSKRQPRVLPPPPEFLAIGSTSELPRNDPLVRRGVLMKVTAKEQQALANSAQMDARRSLLQKRQHGRLHLQKGFHGFTPVEYLPPLPTLQGQSGSGTASGSLSPQLAQVLQFSVTPLTLLRRKFHPTARAKLVGHVRNKSHAMGSNYGGGSSGPVPPLPSAMGAQNSDDNFMADAFDDINLNDVNELPEWPHEVPPLSDEEIMEHYRQARPGLMPLIEHLKTMFLKGFFSVQTTLTKPLPVIRYNIIRVLSKLGVRFQEVKGGFICSHTPLYQPTSDEPEAEITPEERKLYGDAFKLTLSLIDGTTVHTPEMKQVLRQSLLKHMLLPSDIPQSQQGSLSHRLLGSMLGHRRMALFTRQRDNNGQPAAPPHTPAAAKALRGHGDEVDLADDSNEFRAYVLNQPEDSVDSVNMLAVHGGSDMLVLLRIEQRARHHHSLLVLSTGGSGTGSSGRGVKRTPVNFQIEIVKVPIVNLHALILKKIVGNTWNYKHLADRIISDLNL